MSFVYNHTALYATVTYVAVAILNWALPASSVKRVYYDAPMVTRPFSSVIGMSYIRGFKNRFFYFLAQKFLVASIDNTFNNGFWVKISIFFPAKRNERRS